MGDRSQVAIEQSGGKRVYLYAHWAGSNIYRVAARALREVPGRHGDPEYLARAVFCRMVQGAEMKETGYGIGLNEHEDIEHAILVLNPLTGHASFTQPAWKHNKKDSLPTPMSFTDFIERAEKGDFDEL